VAQYLRDSPTSAGTDSYVQVSGLPHVDPQTHNLNLKEISRSGTGVASINAVEMSAAGGLQNACRSGLFNTLICWMAPTP
jgi:hypothetical protein